MIKALERFLSIRTAFAVKGAQQFLFLRIDAEHRVFLVEVAILQRFDDLELLIPLRYISTSDRLFDLSFGKPQIVQQTADGGLTDRRSHLP